MGYVSLTCKFMLNGEQESYRVGRAVEDDEDYLVTEVARCQKEYPGSTDIVVTEDPYNDGYPFALDALIDLILKQRPDLTRAEVEDLDWYILDTDRKAYRRGAYVVSLQEAKAIFDKDKDYRDWVYLRDMGVVIFDITAHTSHEIFLSHWYNIQTHIIEGNKPFNDDVLELDHDSTEKFLHAKMGFFSSSAYGVSSVLKSADLKLGHMERTIFGRFRFRELEPN